MTDPQDLAALVAKLRHADEYEPLGHHGWEAADAIEAQAAEIARLKTEIERLGRDLNRAKYGEPDFSWAIHNATMVALRDRAKKAEAEVEERHQLHLEQVRITNEWIERYDKAEAALTESQAAEEGAMMILTQAIAERDAARKALTESQAREATLHRAITEASEPDFIWGAMDNVNDMDADLGEFAKAVSRAIRAAVPTPADAQAALDARDKAKHDEGRIAGLREALEKTEGGE